MDRAGERSLALGFDFRWEDSTTCPLLASSLLPISDAFAAIGGKSPATAPSTQHTPPNLPFSTQVERKITVAVTI